MPDVLIRECTLRVVRRGGWSWGPSPRQLLAAMLEAVPALIAEKLARLLPEDAAGTVREPITIRVPLRLEDLVTAAGVRRSAASIAAELALALGPQLEAALERIHVERDPAQESRTAAPDMRSAAALLQSHRHFARFLLALAREKTLARMLERLPRDSIRIWYDALFARRSAAISLSAAELLRELPEDLVAALDAIGRPLAARVSESRREMAEIALAALLAEHTGHLPDDAEVLAAVLYWRQSLDRKPAGREIALASAGAAPLADGKVPLTDERAVVAPVRRDSATETVPADVRFETAMPWLALAPLERAGLLEAIAAQFEAAHMEADLPVFAAAFAAKYFACPEPRWKHEAEWRAAISAFAGESRVIPEEDVAGLPRRCRAILPALWLALQSALLKERPVGAPLLLLRLKRGYALADPHESLLLAAAETITGLLGTITLTPDPRVVVDDACIAEAGALAELGISCVAGLEPHGGEWQSVPLAQGRTLWTNGAPLAPQSQAECAAALDGVEEVLRNCSYFVEERESASRSGDLSFESFMGALAMAGAGALATPESPLAVLKHYHGFDALAEMRGGRIRIRLSLGRRYLNLEHAGWLKPLRNIPWLQPRYVEFSRG